MSAMTTESCCDRRPAANQTLTGSAPPALPRAPRNRILFVDDEVALLRVMKMGMRAMANDWDMHFVENGEQALELIEQQAFDVVITDMRMPGMNGAQLLNHVFRLHPQTVRIVLSGYAELSEVMKCVGLTHQYLDKPCSLDDLKDCLRRVTNVQSHISNEKIRAVTAGVKNLPSLPHIYLQIAEAIQSPTASTDRIADIASQDPALCAKLLQLSNSAFFGFSRKVFTVDEAVQLLGVGIIQSLALATPLFSAFDQAKCPDFPLDQIWDHSAQTAALGRKLFNHHVADSHLAEQAFAAGILHDIGKIILADSLPQEYAAILEESRATKTPLFEIERQHFATTHAEVGAYLLAIWGLPIPLVEAVASHHHPRRCGTNELCLSGVVHIANALLHTQDAHLGLIPSPVDTAYLEHIKMTQHYKIWLAELDAKTS